jgi:hypothetical protein
MKVGFNYCSLRKDFELTCISKQVSEIAVSDPRDFTSGLIQKFFLDPRVTHLASPKAVR